VVIGYQPPVVAVGIKISGNGVRVGVGVMLGSGVIVGGGAGVSVGISRVG
jgi:hypothetical protein